MHIHANIHTYLTYKNTYKMAEGRRTQEALFLCVCDVLKYDAMLFLVKKAHHVEVDTLVITMRTDGGAVAVVCLQTCYNTIHRR